MVKIGTGEPQIAVCYDSIDEVRYGKFSQDGRFVYTLTKTGTLNVFNKVTAKLISKLNQWSSENSQVEVDGILGTFSTELGESLVAYRRNRVIKYIE